MTTRVVSPGSGWSWLKHAVNLGRSNPRAIFGAVILLAVVALIPSAIQMALQYGLGLGQEAVMTVVGVTTLVSLFVYPLLIGGLLRVIHAAERGEPTHATAIFDTFRSGQGGGRLIGFGLAMAAIYIGLFLLIIGLFGQDFMQWYWKLITTAQSNPNAAPQLGDLPEGFGTVMALGSLFGLFLAGVYSIGFGQVALAGRGVGQALADGFGGSLKNVLALVVLAVIAFLGYIALVLVFLVVVAVIGIVGAISKALGVLLAVPVLLGMLLLLYVVMFGVMYFMWRDICGDAPTVDAPRDDHIEL